MWCHGRVRVRRRSEVWHVPHKKVKLLPGEKSRKICSFFGNWLTSEKRRAMERNRETQLLQFYSDHLPPAHMIRREE